MSNPQWARFTSSLRVKVRLWAIFVAALATVALNSRLFAQAQLNVSYGSNGVQQLSYAGVLLEDLNQYPSDAFHIWHMQVTDLSGNVIGADGWGETNEGRVWNAATNTFTYTFSWGTISTQFSQNGNNLDMIVTSTNNAGSGVIFDGATIYPIGLHFPSDPAGFSGATQFAYNTVGPSVTVADYGSGEVISVVPDETKPLYTGFLNQGAAYYTPFISGTPPSFLAPFLPQQERPVQPGETDTFTVSLRFAASGSAPSAADAYSSFAATYPSIMTWTDHRAIGTVYLASSPNGSDDTQPGGYPTNPRRYFNDPTVDITTAAGLQAFQDRILAQAQTNVDNANALSAQGVITWDIEGEEYPQPTSYVCSPDQIATVAPEMESTITDTASPYYGQKLDDSYFAVMRSAGFTLGVCIRPQAFTLGNLCAGV